MLLRWDKAAVERAIIEYLESRGATYDRGLGILYFKEASKPISAAQIRGVIEKTGGGAC